MWWKFHIPLSIVTGACHDLQHGSPNSIYVKNRDTTVWFYGDDKLSLVTATYSCASSAYIYILISASTTVEPGGKSLLPLPPRSQHKVGSRCVTPGKSYIMFCAQCHLFKTQMNLSLGNNSEIVIHNYKHLITNIIINTQVIMRIG